jgi:hypothetical protein
MFLNEKKQNNVRFFAVKQQHVLVNVEEKI